MEKKKNSVKFMAVCMLTALLATACGAAAPSEPTQDPNAVFTQVAETVMVSMTQTAEAVPPTAIPKPTATTAPVPTLAPVATSDAPTQESAPTQAIGPTATIPRIGDSAQYNTQTPGDGKVFKPGVDFQFIVCFGNNGTTEWDNTYYLEWVSGYRLWNDTKYFYVEEVVEPGGKWCFYTPAVSPHDPGSYVTRWYFKNGNDQFMQEVYFNYKVEL